MSRLTGNDAYGLMEAYNAVYAPQELTEEQVWEEVEVWVNSLVEEGYDLSEYTWEDMYEAYLNEGGPGARASVPASATGKYKSSSDGKYYRNYNDALAARNSRLNTLRSAQDMLKGKPSSLGATPAERARPPVSARPAASAPAPRPAAPAASVRPSARPAAAPARPSGGAPAPSRPAATPSGTTTAQKPTPAATPAAPQKSFNPLMQRTFGYQTGNSPKEQQARADAIVKSGQVAALKPQPTPAAKPAPTNFARTRSQVLGQSFDPFDVVMGHLLDEGYADTEEAALAIMTSMSEEWRYSIIEAKKEPPNVRIRKQMKRKLGSDKPKDWEDVGYMSGTTGVPVPKH